MKAYVITEGEYSDYSIVCIFLDKEKAENYVKYHKSTNGWFNDIRIEEYDIEDDEYSLIDEGFYLAEGSFTVSEDAKVSEINVDNISLVESREENKLEILHDWNDYSNWRFYIHRCYPERLFTEEEAKQKLLEAIYDISNQIAYYRSCGMTYCSVCDKLEISSDNF